MEYEEALARCPWQVLLLPMERPADDAPCLTIAVVEAEHGGLEVVPAEMVADAVACLLSGGMVRVIADTEAGMKEGRDAVLFALRGPGGTVH